MTQIWFWHRPEAAAPVGSLTWELPCATGAVLKKKKKKKKRNKKDFSVYDCFKDEELVLPGEHVTF